MARTTTPPGIKAGNYRGLSVAEDALFYIRAGLSDADPTELMRYDLKERKEEKVVDGVSRFVLSRDGKKVLYRVKDDWFLADAKAGAKARVRSAPAGSAWAWRCSASPNQAIQPVCRYSRYAQIRSFLLGKCR